MRTSLRDRLAMNSSSFNGNPVILKNNISIYVRHVQKHDVDGVWRNFNDVVADRVFLPVYTPVVSKWERDHWFKEMHVGDSFCLVAINPNEFPEKQVVGQITIEDVSWEAAKHVGQLGIIVQKKYRNQGLGNILIQHAIHEAKQRGKLKLNLTTLSSNEMAVNLYKKCGFKEVGIHQKQYKIKEQFQDELIMEIWIGSE